jgi:Zn-finger in ubiquitin-hydrolases and other protein
VVLPAFVVQIIVAAFAFAYRDKAAATIMASFAASWLVDSLMLLTAPAGAAGRTSCCESSPRRHTLSHFEQTGHLVVANQSAGEPWGWCFADGMPLTPDNS